MNNLVDCALYLKFYIPFELVKIIHDYSYKYIDDDNIHEAVNLYCKLTENAKFKYGNMGYI
jgi:hypothetical protein